MSSEDDTDDSARVVRVRAGVVSHSSACNAEQHSSRRQRLLPRARPGALSAAVSACCSRRSVYGQPQQCSSTAADVRDCCREPGPAPCLLLCLHAAHGVHVLRDEELPMEVVAAMGPDVQFVLKYIDQETGSGDKSNGMKEPGSPEELVWAINELLLQPPLPEQNTDAAECIVKICNILKISAIKMKTENEKNDNSVTDEIVMYMSKKQVPLMIFDKLKVDASNDWKNLVLIYLKCTTLKHFDNISLIHGVKYLILVTEEDLQCVLQEVINVKPVMMHDVTFLMGNTLLSFSPSVDPITCIYQPKFPLRTNSCSQISKPTDIFPRKSVTNFNGCPFTFAFLLVNIFAELEDEKNIRTSFLLTKNDNLKGVDVEIADIIINQVNATKSSSIVTFQHDIPSGLQIISQALGDDYIDALSGLSYFTRKLNVFSSIECTHTYFVNQIFWAYFVKRTPRAIESLIEKLNILYMFFIGYLWFAFLWYIVRLVDRRAVSVQSALLVSWGTLVGTTSLQESRSRKQKFLSILYSFLCIHFSAYMSTQLYTFLVIHTPPATYNSFYDLAHYSGKTIFDSPLMLEQEFQETLHIINSSNIKMDLDYNSKTNQLKALKNNGIIKTASTWFPDLIIQTAENDEARVIRLPENLISMGVYMITRKHGFKSKALRDNVARLHQSGIVNKIYENYAGYEKMIKVRQLTENALSNNYACELGCSIHFSDVAFVFYMWMAGCVFAFCLFVIEINTMLLRRRHWWHWKRNTLLYLHDILKRKRESKSGSKPVQKESNDYITPVSI